MSLLDFIGSRGLSGQPATPVAPEVPVASADTSPLLQSMIKSIQNVDWGTVAPQLLGAGVAGAYKPAGLAAAKAYDEQQAEKMKLAEILPNFRKAGIQFPKTTLKIGGKDITIEPMGAQPIAPLGPAAKGLHWEKKRTITTDEMGLPKESFTWEEVADKTGGMGAADKFATAMSLQKSFTGSEPYKAFSKIAGQYGKMLSAYGQASGNVKSLNGADQALIMTFNKILDETSVVRESEYARTPEGMALRERMKGAISNVQKGGILTPVERGELMRLTTDMYKFHLDNYKSAKDYAVQSADYLNDPKLKTIAIPTTYDNVHQNAMRVYKNAYGKLAVQDADFGKTPVGSSFEDDYGNTWQKTGEKTIKLLKGAVE